MMRSTVRKQVVKALTMREMLDPNAIYSVFVLWYIDLRKKTHKCVRNPNDQSQKVFVKQMDASSTITKIHKHCAFFQNATIQHVAISYALVWGGLSPRAMAVMMRIAYTATCAEVKPSTSLLEDDWSSRYLAKAVALTLVCMYLVILAHTRRMYPDTGTEL